MANNNKHTGPTVPALRFPEFSGEWETKTMLEIAPLQRGFDLPKGNIRPGDIPVVYSNGIMSTHNQSKCIGPGVITGRSGTIGSFTFIPNGPYWPHNTALWVTNFCGNVPLFIYHLYSHIGIVRFASGSGVPTLNRNDVHKHITSIPSNLREQNKIASFLSLLDDRIETQSKIIEEQETLLKSLADSLISSKVANMALYDCVVARSSAMKESELENSGPFPVFGASGLCGYSNEALEESDSILVTKDGSGVGTCQYTTGAHSFLGTLCSLTAKEGVYLPYVYYALLNFNFASFKTGLAIPHIYFKDYGKAVIYCPSYDEQERIASGLEKLEAKINTDKELLKQYRLHKEYLLSRMFI